MDLESFTTGEKLAAVGGATAVVGAFLPWVDAGIIAASGIDGDGIFTLVFGGIAIAIVLGRDWETIDMIGTGVLGVLTFLIVSSVYGNLGSQTGGEFIQVSAGGGLHLTLLAGLLLVGAAVYGYLKERPA